MCELLGLIVVGLVQTSPNEWFLQGLDVETGELVQMKLEKNDENF